jgi:hypothetical protein
MPVSRCARSEAMRNNDVILRLAHNISMLFVLVV